MTFYLIGLGLNLKSISLEALEICRKAGRIYLENYTVELPYKIEELEQVIGKNINLLTRIVVEAEEFVEEGKEKNIVLLVYGSPLTATTHISLILKCRKENIPYKIFHNSSIFDAIAETGLQVYKFGKTASMPKWNEKFKPESFIDIVKNNMKIKAHTLILVDIGLNFSNALKQLEIASRNKIKIEKIVVCSRLGTENSRIFFNTIEELYGREGYAPFCFVIPSDLHFLEKEMLENFEG